MSWLFCELESGHTMMDFVLWVSNDWNLLVSRALFTSKIWDLVVVGVSPVFLMLGRGYCQCLRPLSGLSCLPEQFTSGSFALYQVDKCLLLPPLPFKNFLWLVWAHLRHSPFWQTQTQLISDLITSARSLVLYTISIKTKPCLPHSQALPTSKRNKLNRACLPPLASLDVLGFCPPQWDKQNHVFIAALKWVHKPEITLGWMFWF